MLDCAFDGLIPINFAIQRIPLWHGNKDSVSLPCTDAPKKTIVYFKVSGQQSLSLGQFILFGYMSSRMLFNIANGMESWL